MTAAAAAAYDPAAEPLLERVRELAIVHGLIRDLRGAGADGTAFGPGAARGGLLLFEGTAGIGKTSLVDATRRMAAAYGCPVLYAKGGEREQGRAFHVVRQLFRPLLVAADDRERHELLGGWWDMVSPALGLAPVVPAVPAVPEPQGVRDALDWLMAGLGQRHGPMAVLVDDAHWADRESLAWLESYARTSDAAPVLIVVTRRPEEPTPNADLLDDLAGLPAARRLDLSPLSPDAVAALVRDRLGPGADDEFCRSCHAVTDGIPYIVGQLVGEVADRDLRPTAA
ncbi:MAG: ATP-binding protein, partial [Streptomycetaceae bacterium]|nr:ATP-binding protein [Streptomycetaceae bacterium]